MRGQEENFEHGFQKVHIKHTKKNLIELKF